MTHTVFALRTLFFAVVGLAVVTAASESVAQTVSIPYEQKSGGVTAPTEPSPAAPDVISVTPTAPAVAAKPIVSARPSVAPNIATNSESRAPAILSTDPVVPGMTPEDVARTRQAYDELVARNPAASGEGPYALLQSLRPRRELQKSISDRVRKACKLDYFNVLIPFDMPYNLTAFANLKNNGADAIVGAITSVCNDKDVRKGLLLGVGIFTINQAGGQATPVVSNGNLSVSLSYDFQNPAPFPQSLLQAQLLKAFRVSDDKAVPVYQRYENSDQDKMYENFAQELGYKPGNADKVQ